MGFLRLVSNITTSMDTDYSHSDTMGYVGYVGYIMLGLSIIWSIGCILINKGYCERCNISRNRTQLVPLRFEICAILWITGILYGLTIGFLYVHYK